MLLKIQKIPLIINATPVIGSLDIYQIGRRHFDLELEMILVIIN
jgi:hypothetical protein